MKQLSILIFLLIIFSCKKEVLVKNSYLISANAPGVYNGMRAYLKAPGERGRLVNRDTAIVIDEKFTFEGKRTEPNLEYLFINGSEGFLPIIVENGDITIDIEKDSIHTSIVTGSHNNIEFQKYSKKEKRLNDKISQLTTKYRTAAATNSDDKQTIYNTMNQAKIEVNKLPITFIKENPNSFVSILLFNEAIKNSQHPLNEIESAYRGLSQQLKETAYGKNIASFIDTQKKILEAQKATQVGGIAPDFSAPTPNGELLALNDIKGKVTLIDFWASWCGPCRRENPNVVKVYNDYHDKGLEIISISLDRNGQKARWLKAIKDDKMTWHHVSNLKFWQDPIAKTYSVRSIPATFLLDENGKIVAKNLRGPTLGNKVAELLN